MTDAPRSAAPPAPAGGWHGAPASELLEHLDSTLAGLSDTEADLRGRRWGANRIDVAGATPWWRVLLRQFLSPLIGILVIATVVTTVLREWVDATAILFILVLNAGIGYWQERRAETAVLALRELAVPSCRVVRDGTTRRIDAAGLVPGDVVPLESGERVPADLRMLEVADLRVDESLLTGEVLPVGKTAGPLPGSDATERTNLAFSGTLVTSGRGQGLVVATGDQTEIGEISELVQRTRSDSPLQIITNRLERRIGIVVAVASLTIFALGVLLGHSPSEMFRTAVALAVASVPESLPIVLTVAMSLGVARMAHHHAIVRSLPAVETLGSTTLIGSDKTGTLTLNRLTVQVVWSPVGVVDRRQGGDEARDGWAVEAHEVLRSGALTNEAVPDPHDEGRLHGDAVDVAFALAALDAGAVTAEERARPPVADLPYEPHLRLSQTVRRERDGTLVLHVKGSPDVLAGLSTHLRGQGGALRAMDLDLVERANEEMACEGLRVIATATRVLAPDEPAPSTLDWPAGLTFLGLAGLEDPPREGVLEAVEECRRAGVRVTMITGDHPATASAIAGRLGLDTSGEPVTGRELAELDDAALSRRLATSDVAARVTPQDKLRITRSHEARGEVVAVTGDGVNDAPALKAASIGVAMGRSGTDVAREAADIVLTDDNFVTIVEAIRQGRVTFAAIRNATFFLLASGLASLVAVSTNVVVGGPLLFLPVQLLFINVVTNGLQDIALAFEPAEANVLSHPPRPRGEGILSGALWWRLVITGLWLAASILMTFQWALAQDHDLQHARTLAITMFVWMNFYLVGTARSEHRAVLGMSPVSNRLLILSALGALFLHWGATVWSPAAHVLGFVPLTLDEWLACAVLGATAMIMPETHKLLLWWRHGRRQPGAPPAS
ncbi:cation-translocating P-type ATPase [Ornithinimicrobium sp. LYQ121]|uniref:cation-translocating P-type ATPase n=1 Tax=Ornithinimicrobium sp. LYQ121 TaxID=3378801 RepID=UPI003851C75B